MFDRRLGLALGKSEGEIRSIPYPEYRRWQLHYMLEPWGWHNDEYLMASIVAMIHNVNCSEKKDMKERSDFMRNMEEAILEELNNKIEIDRIHSLPVEEQRKILIPIIKRDLGIT
jgi:hypothetical protein